MNKPLKQTQVILVMIAILLISQPSMAAMTIDHLLKQYSKSDIVHTLNNELETMKVTILVNGHLQLMARPNPELITERTVKIDLKRLNITVDEFAEILDQHIAANKKRVESHKQAKKRFSALPPYQAPKQQIFKAVSGIEADKAFVGAKGILKQRLKDPDSLQIIKQLTFFGDKNDQLIIVALHYRAKNSFGGYSVEMATIHCRRGTYDCMFISSK